MSPDTHANILPIGFAAFFLAQNFSSSFLTLSNSALLTPPPNDIPSAFLIASQTAELSNISDSNAATIADSTITVSSLAPEKGLSVTIEGRTASRPERRSDVPPRIRPFNDFFILTARIGPIPSVHQLLTPVIL